MKLCSLESVAKVIRGITFSKAEGATISSNDRLPVIRAGSIQQSLLLNEGQIWVPAKKIKPQQLIRKNDIVMCTSSGSSDLVGKCAKSTIDWSGSFGAFCVGIRADESKCNSSYLYHFLCSPLFRNWTKSSSGANIKNIRASELAAFKIPLPPLKEQKRIAAILDKADAIRRKRQQAIDLTDQLLRSVFLDMFGDPVTNPKRWEKIKLGNLCGICRGGSPRPIQKYLGGTVPWIKIGDATKGNDIYLDKTKEKIFESGLSKTRYLQPGALIFANCGVSLGFARILKIAGCIHDGWLALEINDERLNQLFLLKALNQITKHFQIIAPDGTQPNLNTAIMKDFELILPPIELQEKFENIVFRVNFMRATYVDAHVVSYNAFNSLTKNAFNGELTKQSEAA